jgi:hypothetical protein
MKDVVPIIKGEREPPKTRRGAEEMKKEVRRIAGWLDYDNKELTPENVLKVLERNHKVSEADVSVMASAIAAAHVSGGDVVVAGKDRDFRDALELMKDGGEGLPPSDVGGQLHYSTPYSSAA